MFVGKRVCVEGQQVTDPFQNAFLFLCYKEIQIVCGSAFNAMITLEPFRTTLRKNFNYSRNVGLQKTVSLLPFFIH